MKRKREMEVPNGTQPLSKGTPSRFIPEDILRECLARLPVKYLIDFKAVSRSWNNLISSADFADMHFRHSKTSEQLLRVGLPRGKFFPEMTLLKLRGTKDTMVGDGFRNLQLPFVALPSESLTMEGSCNGLLVFRTRSNPGIVLYNPATRRFRHLRTPCDNTWFSSTSIGFCFISEMKDYKIVMIQNIRGELSSSGAERYPGWVYSLNSDSWKKLDLAFPRLKNRERTEVPMATILNESLHWIANEDESMIMAFDPKNEALQYMSFPVPEHLVRPFGRLLTIIEGSLSVVLHLDNGLGFEVWKMSEYGVEASWTKLFSIDKFRIFVQPLGSWNGSRSIVFKYWGGNDGDLLFSYNPSTRKIQPFSISPTLNLQVINYVESMESVEGGMKRISKNRRMARPIDGQYNKTLKSSRNFKGGRSRKGKRKLQ